MCLQFVYLEKMLKYDIAKIYVFQPQNPNCLQNTDFASISLQ